MSLAAQWASQITVCHREPGFLRLALPLEFCQPEVLAALENGMTPLAGITVVTVDAGWQRISIRYDAGQLSTAQVARQLFAVIDALPETALIVPTEAILAPAPLAQSEATPPQDHGLQPLFDKLKAALLPPDQPLPGTLRARFQHMLESALTEKAVTNFFNDIVAFYLIKVHWELISKRWLHNPAAHSNAWLTTFYLIFLLIRYRKSP